METRCGIDIIEVKRIEEVVKKWGDRFLNKVFTDEEIQYAKSKKFFCQHLAARFAAKEAILKALGNKKLSLRNIQIINDGNKGPSCKLGNEKQAIQISMSHTRDYAIGSVVLIDSHYRHRRTHQ